MRKFGLIVLASIMILGLGAVGLDARPNYKKAWDKKYVQGNEDEGFVSAAKAAKCNVCHKGKSKKMRNAYGMALSKMLKKEKNEDKIVMAFEKAEGMKAPDAEKTFGEKIKAGKLPAAE